MNTTTKEKIRFSKAFWVANTVELFERAAYYGVFIVITLYLSRILGFNDIQASSEVRNSTKSFAAACSVSSASLLTTCAAV